MSYHADGDIWRVGLSNALEMHGCLTMLECCSRKQNEQQIDMQCHRLSLLGSILSLVQMDVRSDVCFKAPFSNKNIICFQR